MKKLPTYFKQCLSAKLNAFLFLIILLSTCKIARAEVEFNHPIMYGSPSAYSLTSGDFNGDGYVDLAVTNYDHNTISIYINLCNGRYRLDRNYSVSGYNPIFIATGDFNNDELIDLVVISKSGCISIFAGHGDGYFHQVSAISNSGASSLATGDFDQDGCLDLFIAHSPAYSQVRILKGNGNFTFSYRNDIGVNFASSIISEDFNKDGYLDLATTSDKDNRVYIWRGNGSGSFYSYNSYNVGNFPVSIGSGYFDKDEYIDLAIANRNSRSISILFGQEEGMFLEAQNIPSAGYLNNYIDSMAIGDFDNNGNIDIVATQYTGSNNVAVIMNNGDRTFQPAKYFNAVSAPPRAIITGDIDNDSRADIITVSYYSRVVSTLLNTTSISPIAVADWSKRTVYVGDLVELDGSNSYDPNENYPLTYEWIFVCEPWIGSATLSDPNTVNPTFTIEAGGSYELQLIVTNSGGNISEPDYVRINSNNSFPIADAGDDETVRPGTIVTLDGSGSYDPDIEDIYYIWTFISKPEGSTALLSDGNSVTPYFTVDLPGKYVIQLIIVDPTGASSTPDEVVINTLNTVPVADAGEDQTISLIGSIVYLDGSGSYDSDGDSVTYSWSIKSAPEGSSATLINPNSPEASFVADIHGKYIIELKVNDFWSFGLDTLIVSFDNVKPVADAGDNQSVEVGETVYLDGSDSTDANGDFLTYSWSFVSRPENSNAELSSTDAEMPSFDTDKPGIYTVSLIVNDGFENSESSSITITAVATVDYLSQELMDVTDIINSFDKTAFVNKHGKYRGWQIKKRILTKKINLALGLIDKGHYRAALHLLQQGVLHRMDGCANTGVPDKNDWISDCAAQDNVYPLIVDAIDILNSKK